MTMGGRLANYSPKGIGELSVIRSDKTQLKSKYEPIKFIAKECRGQCLGYFDLPE